MPSEEMFDFAYKVDLFSTKILQILAENIRHSKKICSPGYIIANDLLPFLEKLLVPDYQNFTFQIFCVGHDSQFLYYLVGAKTLEPAKQYYY